MRRIVMLLVGLVLVGAAGCNHDGRTLRPAQPGQDVSISTTSPTSSTIAGPGVGDGGILGVAPSASVATSVATTSTAGAAASTTKLGVTAAWSAGAAIPTKHSCDGANVSPALSWPSAPADAVEIAITMTDLDAPSFIHWTVSGLDATTTSIAEGAVPSTAAQGLNSAGTPGYTGPCPPAGSMHRYLLAVHYLGSQIELGDGAAAADMLAAIDASTILTAELRSTYSRA